MCPHYVYTYIYVQGERDIERETHTDVCCLFFGLEFPAEHACDLWWWSRRAQGWLAVLFLKNYVWCRATPVSATTYSHIHTQSYTCVYGVLFAIAPPQPGEWGKLEKGHIQILDKAPTYYIKTEHVPKKKQLKLTRQSPDRLDKTKRY